jgi:DNA-binding transcriptional ArsR family regulator
MDFLLPGQALEHEQARNAHRLARESARLATGYTRPSGSWRLVADTAGRLRIVDSRETIRGYLSQLSENFLVDTKAIAAAVLAVSSTGLSAHPVCTGTRVHFNITKQTASSHLSKLVESGLLLVQSQGRHRYFQLAAPDVAAMLESIMGVAQRTREARKLLGPRDPALRRARRCYDHLAGELAVEAYDSFVRRGLIRLAHQKDSNDTLALTPEGHDFFDSLGFDLDHLAELRRPVCRPCLDWSVRRHHLAGSLGKTLLDYCYEERWARQIEGSRIVRFNDRGEKNFRRTLMA